MNEYLSHLQQKVELHPSVFVAANATVIGDVTIQKQASVWFYSLIRGDSDSIYIGEKTNIQDHTIIHVDKGVPVVVGSQVVVGHRCILHGCTIGNRSLIGMGSILMNHSQIGDECIIGANTLIPENTIIPPRSLVIGSPGKIVKPVTDDMIAKILSGVEHYRNEAKKYIYS